MERDLSCSQPLVLLVFIHLLRLQDLDSVVSPHGCLFFCYQFPILETIRGIGTNIRRKDFWDHLGRQKLLSYDWLIINFHTID